MPHSPYQKTIHFHAPIHDLAAYHRDLRMYRVYWDKGEEYGFHALMDGAETLLKHCDFLEEKLRLEVSHQSFPSPLPIVCLLPR